MTSELSIFAARLREQIGFCAEEFSRTDAVNDSAWAQHSDAEFNGLAILLFTLQFKHNQPYRIICEAQGVTPDALTHWTQIPTVPTAAFKELELTSLPSEQRTQVFHSSGTTEQRPSRHFHSAESLAVYEASLWLWLKENCGLPIADCRLLSLTPSPKQAPQSSLVHMFDFARRQFGADESIFLGRAGEAGSWTLDIDVVLAKLGCSRRREQAESAFQQTPSPHGGGYEKPVLLLGTAFSFVHLLDALVERNLRLKLPGGSRVLETGGYKGRSRTMPKDELHRLIVERLGVSAENIICEYGMSELSSQAYDAVGLKPEVQSLKSKSICEASRHPSPPVTRHFRFPPWARARVVSPETGREVAEGETGLLQVFDLANVFSVLAIQTEDLAVRRGAGFELIGRAQLAEPRGCSLMTA